jgi:transcriptional regulator with XRE-family HTH domain
MAEEDELYQRRQGFWLRMARERAGKSQAGAAELIGLKRSSKSSISDYENGVTPVPMKMLRRFAEWYGVPLRVFTEPKPTAYEQLDDEIAAMARSEEGETPQRQRGWWLQLARERVGLTRGQVASRLGVTTRTIEAWEERRSQPTIQQESALAELMDVSIRRPPAPAVERQRRRTA